MTLEYRTTERVVVLNLPGQPQREFKLRLAASPTHSDKFSPWHLADRINDLNRRFKRRNKFRDRTMILRSATACL